MTTTAETTRPLSAISAPTRAGIDREDGERQERSALKGNAKKKNQKWKGENCKRKEKEKEKRKKKKGPGKEVKRPPPPRRAVARCRFLRHRGYKYEDKISRARREERNRTAAFSSFRVSTSFAGKIRSDVSFAAKT
ncbi:hypothetical protein RHGRI_035955 [Rhododendron griersonianum]|uniref:Uncharacterized protein n=1 Tax=Rhododendron griersonianum TaxID=479676 RepID=A0AAV6HQ76_9ERIC|nr:hypothetical protein RHGRI_035955 [Rhododendron griersonianum]KAG5514737.1 hypothetical protein RHGRI_035955 [Rhododendron griersonianum]